MMTSEQVALSASHAAWVGAIASGCASIIALGIAIFGAYREEGRRSREAKEQEKAFCFAMVGALEMIKPIIVQAQLNRDTHFDRRKFIGMIDHALMIAQAGLAISVFDMQLLLDAYQLRGALNYLRALSEEHPETVPNAAIYDVLDPFLDHLIAADDRFFHRLPPIATIEGIGGRTPLSRV